MSGGRELLFATIAAGGGHVATASALAEAVTAYSDGAVPVRVSEVMPELGFDALDRRHKESWRGLLGRPRLVRWAQRAMDAAPGASRTVQDLLLAPLARAAAERFRAESVALIVVNHGWLATAFTLARRRYGLEVPVVVFATEPFDASALWSTPAAETVLAPSTAAAESLMRLGVPKRAISVAGYPVARRFLEAPTQVEARARLGLSEHYTCLLSLGAEGVAGFAGEDLIAAVARLAELGVQVLCVCGRNDALRRRLERLDAGPPSPRAYGFVRDMETYLAACDVVVGKAGPASTMEALAIGRPLVITAYAGLNELAVVHYLRASGRGELCLEPARLPAAVAAWRDRPKVGADAPRLGDLPAPDFAAMTSGLGEYLARRALGEPSPSGLRPGAFELVDADALRLGADAVRASPTGPPARRERA